MAASPHLSVQRPVFRMLISRTGRSGSFRYSICRFAGTDIDVFTQFANHFGVTANYLTRTFRSNQGITDVAAAFIQKNPSQMGKQVQAQDPTFESSAVRRWPLRGQLSWGR